MTTNVIPFRQQAAKVDYVPGVAPFDPGNPAHIRAWNALFAFGWAEQRAEECK
jgi:hypothetical protein